MAAAHRCGAQPRIGVLCFTIMPMQITPSSAPPQKRCHFAQAQSCRVLVLQLPARKQGAHGLARGGPGRSRVKCGAQPRCPKTQPLKAVAQGLPAGHRDSDSPVCSARNPFVRFLRYGHPRPCRSDSPTRVLEGVSAHPAHWPGDGAGGLFFSPTPRHRPSTSPHSTLLPHLPLAPAFTVNAAPSHGRVVPRSSKKI